MGTFIFGAIVAAPFAMWAGDYLGRKYPTHWVMLRAGLKRVGDRVVDRLRTGA